MSDSLVLLDDLNSAIVYSAGWKAVTGGTRGLYGTKHGADMAGLTATFNFTGTHALPLLLFSPALTVA